MTPARTINCSLLIFAVCCVASCDSETGSNESDSIAVDDALDTNDGCEQVCDEIYALVFDFEDECVISNTADYYLGCIPYSSCDPTESSARFCLVSPERDALVVMPNQIDVMHVMYLKEELGWQSCRDIFDVVPEEFESMFPVCGEG